ncbi:hypothetical protein [Denitrobaculum tricleocarpae]|uniref:DUF3137 domain-containing protein n=1 Tax=Denitrobaculum tricleocarpae TaxID=2591009 RepID=A0A545TTK0_9PROT|nr:hypothetical protein [Denitrobaculum tricleocarpae]TQV80544.1 hypothetical protein FKG95_10235 [Denitrobaculum tricleocarpae]
MPVALIIFFALLFLLGILVVSHHFVKEKKRRTEFIRIAEELGLSFSKKADRAFRKRLKDFGRFASRGGKYRASPVGKYRYHANIINVLRDSRNGVEMVFFECRQRWGKSGAMDSVFYFRSPSMNLPQFSLREMLPATQLLLGFMTPNSGINLKNHPKFSEMYYLTSNNEKAVLKLFDDKLVSFLENQDGFHIEANHDEIIIYTANTEYRTTNYRPYKRIEPHEFKQLRSSAIDIFEHFRA